MRLHVVLSLLLLSASLPAGSVPLGFLRGKRGEARREKTGMGGGSEQQPAAQAGGDAASEEGLPDIMRFTRRVQEDASEMSNITLSANNGLKGFRTFRDSAGRERIFHGVNAVVKGEPWVPFSGKFDKEISLGADDLAFLQNLGVNVIRLGIMWAGVEPMRGTYNEGYLMAVQRMTKEAAKYGIYTLLDMHQDVMSDKFCGEGLPAWAAQPTGMTFPMPVKSGYDIDPRTGFPTGTDCAKSDWATYYFSQAVSTAFQNLYDNWDGLLDAWGDMWGEVARVFKDDKHILGVELINEPWAGDIIKNPLLMVPGVADKKNLQPAYEKLNAAIRAVDPSVLIFFEGVTWGHPGFDRVPGGPMDSDRSVLAYHHYEYPAGPRKGNTSDTDIVARIADGKRLSSGLFLTEFAEAGGPGGDIWDAVTGACDKHGQSWASWEYKTFCRDDPAPFAQCGSFGCCKTGFGGHMFGNGSTLQPKEAAAKLARTYAWAVAGELVTAGFDPTTHVYSLTYAPDPSILLPTSIYASEQYHYPGGLDVVITPPGSAIWIRVPNGVEVALSPDQPAGPPARITVKIYPVDPNHPVHPHKGGGGG